MDECQVSLTGYVATQPRARTFDSGANNVRMRVAWTVRRRDRVTGEWTDGDTSYVTVFCWRRLAMNAAVSLRTGDRVVVKGRLLVRTYEDKEGTRRSTVDIDATSIGHDLNFGVTRYMRVRPETGMTAAEYDAAIASGQLTPGAGNGNGRAPGDRPGSGNGIASGQGLRFAGGLESAGASEIPDLHSFDGEEDAWDREEDDSDLDSGADSPDSADDAGAAREAVAVAEAEVAAAT